MSRHYQKFNINDSVRIKLTDAGRLFLSERHQALLPNMAFNARPEDENGYSEWQLHELMSALGGCLYGVHLPFETTIEFEVSE